MRRWFKLARATPRAMTVVGAAPCLVVLMPVSLIALSGFPIGRTPDVIRLRIQIVSSRFPHALWYFGAPVGLRDFLV